MFLKEKLDRVIKSRGCSDGSFKRKYTTEAETSLPTVSLEAMMSCYWCKWRYVVVRYIPDEFSHATFDPDIYILFVGTISELILRLYITEIHKEKQ